MKQVFTASHRGLSKAGPSSQPSESSWTFVQGHLLMWRLHWACQPLWVGMGTVISMVVYTDFVFILGKERTQDHDNQIKECKHKLFGKG